MSGIGAHATQPKKADIMVHVIASVSVQPIAVMTHWRLFQVLRAGGRRSRHLVGRANDEGRVSSALVQINIVSMTATSESGRVYTLRGPPGFEPDAEYVWSVWLDGARASHAKDMTRSFLVKLRRLQGGIAC